MEFDFTLTGRTPLLMSADNIEAADELNAWRNHPDNKKLSVRGDDRSPPWTWMTRLHHDGTQLAIPSDVIMAVLREAGKKMTMKGMLTFKGESQSALFIADEYCKFAGSKGSIALKACHDLKSKTYVENIAGVEKLGFQLLCKRVAVEKKKHVRVRPKFPVWTITGRIEIVDDSVLKEDVLQNLFLIAGSKCGLLDNRPNAKSPGAHGQFDTKLIRVA